MRIRNVDNDTWDWQFGQSQSNYTKNLYAIQLDIQMKLKEWYQDCFFALQNGIPWSVRLGSHNQKALLDSDILRVTQTVEGVLNVFNFTSNVIGRRYTCSFNVYTQYSTESIPVEFSGVI